MTDIVKAPWTREQVIALWRWQMSDVVHPFTCGKRDDHPEFLGDKGVLIPTVNGWVCMFCDYRQDWCHKMMLTPLCSHERTGRFSTDEPRDGIACMDCGAFLGFVGEKPDTRTTDD